MLHKLLTRVWADEEILKNWNERIIIKIPNKRNLSKYENWRAISLLSAISKIMTMFILNGLKTFALGTLPSTTYLN